MKIGVLTSGGDCPALNAVLRGLGKYVFENIPKAEIIGIPDGYGGLIEGEGREMKRSDFSGILNIGGTILGTSRQPFKKMNVKTDEDPVSKAEKMKENYKKMKLDCLVTLGGAGTHKSAALLSGLGLNVIGLPKTIDNDIYGTDFTFGFHSAVDVATECIDRIHTTAASHGRTMLVEIMGNKVGWLTLYAGIAGGADIILLPELPFDVDRVTKKILQRAEDGKAFSIIAVAEGAMTAEEAAMKKKERLARREEMGYTTVTEYLAKQIAEKVGVDTRIVVPGHLQRGGAPSPYDRLISTQVGSYAGYLIKQGIFGVSVAICGDNVTHNKLQDIAGKTKFVPVDHPLIKAARDIGVSFGVKRP